MATYEATLAGIVQGQRITAATLQGFLAGMPYDNNFDINRTRKVVIAGGGGDYTDIADAMTAIGNGATISGHYIVEIGGGSYVVAAGSEGYTQKNYLHWHGAGKDDAILTGSTHSSASSPI